MVADLKKYRLKRTGAAPFSFVGECLAHEEGRHHGGRDQPRWINVALYRAQSGDFAIAVVFQTRCPGETEHHTVLLVQDSAGAASALRAHDPIPPEIVELLSPVGDGRRSALGALRRMYEDRASGVLSSLTATELAAN
jgi:hypothetical protein